MKLHAYRIEQGLTLTAFGAIVGVTEAAICRYEHGRIPEPAVMARIFAATNGRVAPADFYDFALKGESDDDLG